MATFAILILAANTAFADFPRVSSLIAQDGYLPRQLANRGDRLVYSNGIVILSIIAAALIVAFSGDTSALIPLYAVGVFTCFTLSQAGMVIHHRKLTRQGLEVPADLQRGRRRGDRHRARRRRRVEVHHRRVDPGCADPDHRGAVPIDPQALRTASARPSTCRTTTGRYATVTP